MKSATTIGLFEVEKDTYVIVFEDFQPPFLFEIPYFFGKNILKTLVVRKHIHMYRIEIVSPNL